MNSEDPANKQKNTNPLQRKENKGFPRELQVGRAGLGIGKGIACFEIDKSYCFPGEGTHLSRHPACHRAQGIPCKGNENQPEWCLWICTPWAADNRSTTGWFPMRAEEKNHSHAIFPTLREKIDLMWSTRSGYRMGKLLTQSYMCTPWLRTMHACHGIGFQQTHFRADSKMAVNRSDMMTGCLCEFYCIGIRNVWSLVISFILPKRVWEDDVYHYECNLIYFIIHQF